MDRLSGICTGIIRISFGLLFILVPIVLSPWNYELFEYNKMMLTYGLTAVITGVWIIKMIADQKISIKRTPLDIPIILFFLSQLISALFSMDPHVSWFGYYSRFNGGMFSVLSYVLLYYAFVSNFSLRGPGISMNDSKKSISVVLFSEQHIQTTLIRLLRVMLITGLVVSLYGIAEHFGIDKNLWVQDVQNRVFSTLGQPNWLAAYLIALIPLSGAFWVSNAMQKKFTPSVFYLSTSVIFFITLLWTRSRSGFMALALSDLVFWAVLYLYERKKATRRLLTRLCCVIHGIFLIIIIVNGVYIKQIDDWITIQAWRNRLSNITRPQSETQQNTATMSGDVAQTMQANDATQSASPLIESGITDSGDIRKYVWQGAINIWRSSPKAFFIGTGTETYAFAFYQYKPIGHNLTSEWDFLYNKAHNEYLNFLATTGILGLGTYVLLIGSFMYWFISHKIRSTKSEARNTIQIQNSKYNSDFDIRISDFVQIGLFAGWISLLVTNFFGFSVVIMQIFFYLFPAIICALSSLTGNDKNSEALYRTLPIKWNEKTKKIMYVSTSLIATLIIFMILIAWFSDKEFAKGYHYSRAGYLPQAYQSLSTAINLNPSEPMFHDEQGNVLATLAVASWKENQATISQELSQMSIRENDIALSISPNNVNFWKSRTKIFYALSVMDPDFMKEAIKALEYGVTLSPLDPKMYYNLAILYGQTNQTDKALGFMKKSIELKPNYREGYLRLSLMYNELDRPQEAGQVLKEYLQNVDPADKEFIELTQ